MVCADDEASALLGIRTHYPAAIICDTTAFSDGRAVFVRQVHATHDLPVIVLSRSPDEIEELLAFAAGAADYLPWEGSLRVLAARLRAVTMRSGRSVRSLSAAADVLRHGVLMLTHSTRHVSVGEAPVHLTRTEFDLLAHLMGAPRVAFERNDLLRRVWGHSEGDTHVLEVHVSRLRAKILAAGGPRVIQAVRGVGYRLSRSGYDDTAESPRRLGNIRDPDQPLAATGCLPGFYSITSSAVRRDCRC